MICPICKRHFDGGAEPGKGAPAGAGSGPFCSARCRTVDLGNWLDGGYRIVSPLSEEDLDGADATDATDDEPADPTTH